MPALSLTLVLTRLTMGGEVVSSRMLAFAFAEVLLALSRNWAETVFAPLPAESVQVLPGPNGSQSLQFVPALLNRMLATTPLLSDAESVRITMGLVVKPAPLLIRLVPVGGTMSVRMVRLVVELFTV